jgi:hypothetical protein
LLVTALLGALTNVIIAWVCATTIDVSSKPGTTTFILEDGNWIRMQRWSGAGATRVATRRMRDVALQGISPGPTPPRWQIGPSSSARLVDRCADGRGWPLASMWCHWNQLPGNARWTSPRRIIGGIESKGVSLGPRGERAVIPLRPLWPGFVINTALFALVPWMLLMVPIWLRALWRRRRRLCTACGYPVGAGSTCTECGAALHTANQA